MKFQNIKFCNYSNPHYDFPNDCGAILGKNCVVPSGGATPALPRDGVAKEFRRDPAVGPRSKVWTRGQKWKK